MHPEFIQKLTNLVEANLANENFGPEDLAREAGMSHSNLNRKLKTISNQNASQFIREVRLKKAKELLQNEDATVSEISYRVGFGSPTYFNRCFHEYFGYSPGEVRNHNSPENHVNGFNNKKKIIPQKKNRIGIIYASVIVLFLMISGVWLIHRRIMANKCLSKILPQAEQYMRDANYTGAFNLVQKAGRFVPKNKLYHKLDSLVSAYQCIYSVPSGAKVFFKAYTDSTETWKYLGKTPLDSVKIPSRSMFIYKIIKPGYDTIIAAQPSIWHFYRKLYKKGTVPPGMVPASVTLIKYYGRIPAGVYSYSMSFEDFIRNDSTCNFFIDKFEVTNAEYKKFITAGGYQDKKYWKNPFIKEKKQLTWEEAMLLFTDKTGKPGPSTWQEGDCPPGEEDYPVSGISWYEAAAYAEFAGKELPSYILWMKSRGFEYFDSFVKVKSNFSRKGLAKAGYYKGMNAFGTFDMLGNVREWCMNGDSVLRVTCGGAWNDPFYASNDIQVINTFDRSEKNGLRCVKYIEREKIPSFCFEAMYKNNSPVHNYYEEKVLSDAKFNKFKKKFQYDKTPLNAKVERTDNSNKDYILEKITLNTAYDSKRMIVYLSLPKNSSPPYQAVVIYPGIDWFMPGKSEDLIQSMVSGMDFFVKGGRALVFIVLYGYLERAKDIDTLNNFYYTGLKKMMNDFSRTVDYLETRDDIDTKKIATWGISWGGLWSSVLPAIDDRVKASIICLHGMLVGRTDYPEMSQKNYITRTKIPTLMLSGKYDIHYNYEGSIKPMFDLLGTPAKDKKLKLYETDHYIPDDSLVFESIAWLDKYLGPVYKK